MEMRTILLIGAGVAALGVGALVLSSRASGAPADPALTDLPAYYPPMVSGGGYSGSIDPGGLNQSGAYSTDSMISSIIASNLSVAQLESNTTLESARIDKDVALAGYANELALQKEKNTGATALQSLMNSGAVAMAQITGSNERELAKITGSNSVAQLNAKNAAALALQKQKDTTAISLRSFDALGKTGGKVNAPGKGGVLTVKVAKKK